MGKGEQTREHIVAQAARLFSLRGYFGASMSDLLRATGLEKGGLYNHFRGKDALALEAFEFAAGLLRARLRERIRGRESALERLFAVLEVFRSLIEDPLLPGGCLILNTAVECDDAHPVLAARARRELGRWEALLVRFARQGVASGQLPSDLNPRALASVMLAMLEGAVMLSHLHGDPRHMERTVEHLAEHLHGLALFE